jgi:N-acetylglucosamine-6-phosphate deacetylase
MAHSMGAIDIHFHGAFGIDLMTAGSSEFDELSQTLWKQGVAGFCPTTLSTDPETLAASVARLGQWITQRKKSTDSSFGAIPIGIHLEGPFLNISCCGAHPPGMLRALSLKELNHLWKVSQGTLRILTIAPETLSSSELTKLASWAKARRISLSLGHSQATEAQAKQAFQQGFRGITHAWNALAFHQRSPGALGAALGRRETYVELIIDQVHVAPTLIQWTQKLHPKDRLCFISDCVPAAETSKGKICSFGPLKIQYQDGACRLVKTGALAGGGKVLTRSFCEWVQSQAHSPIQMKKALNSALPSITTAPLWAVQSNASEIRNFSKFRVNWGLKQDGSLAASPR